MRLSRSALLAAPLLLCSGGCAVFAPSSPSYSSIEFIREALDSSKEQAQPMPDHVSAQRRFLMYLPNRLLDVFDLFKVSLGVGPGFGFEIYASDNIWISYQNLRSWRLALDGRASGIYEEGMYREWHLGDRVGAYGSAGRAPLWALGQMRPYEAPLVPGVPAVGEVPKNTWDIGLALHFLIGAEVLVRPFEVFDLLVGLWTEDPAEDDYGLRHYPLHDYAPQSKIVDIFINAIDQMNEEDLRKVLSADLRKQSLLRRGRQLVPLVDDGRTVRPSGERPVGDRGQDYILIGDIDIEPDVYRNPETGNLDLSVRCTGAKLRWGVPAQLEYTLSFANRFLRGHEAFELCLQVEQEHWVITRIRDLNRDPR
ncbi:MAG: hypothetical protein V2A76_07585 [Planctomycetota bacterium]